MGVSPKIANEVLFGWFNWKETFSESIFLASYIYLINDVPSTPLYGPKPTLPSTFSIMPLMCSIMKNLKLLMQKLEIGTFLSALRVELGI